MKPTKKHPQITVPKPFEFDLREQTKQKSIREQKLEEMILEKQLEEEFHLNYRPKALPPPAEVMIPKYHALTSETKSSKPTTKPVPFSFSAERPKKQTSTQEAPPKFKAKPPPPTNSVPLFTLMQNKEQLRKEEIRKQAEASLSLAKLPPRMEMHPVKSQATPTPEPSQFKARNPPDFSKLWQKFAEQLESKKQKAKPTVVQEFKFKETKKKSKNLTQLDQQPTSLLKGFLGLVKKHILEPKHPPKTTKKQTELEAKLKKDKEEKLKQAEKLKQEEHQRQLKYQEAAKRFKASGILQKKLQEEVKAMQEKSLQAKIKASEDHKKHQEQVQKMQDKVNQRPIMVETINYDYSKNNSKKRTLNEIKKRIPTEVVQNWEEALQDLNAEDLV